MQPFSSRSRMALTVFTLLAAAGNSLSAQNPVRSRAEETLEWWNQIGGKLIAMARDFPEDKYDFKVQKDERSFAENLFARCRSRLRPRHPGFRSTHGT